MKVPITVEDKKLLDKTLIVLSKIHDKIVNEGYVDSHIAQACVQDITHILLTSEIVKDKYKNLYSSMKGGPV